MKHIPGSKTTAAGVRAAAEARAVARNTTVAVATGVVVEVATPSPSPASISSSSSSSNSLDAIEPWTVPPKNKTVRFILPPEVIPEDTDTSDDEEVPESEQNNKAVEVAPSIVDSISLSVTEGREMTPLPDSTSAERHSVASSSDPPTPISPSVATNINVVHNIPKGSTKEMRSRPSTTQERSRRFTPLGFRPPMLRRSSAMNSSDLVENMMDEVDETKEHALAVNEARGSKRAADRVGTSSAQGRDTTQGKDMAIGVDAVKEVPVSIVKKTVRFTLPPEVIPEDTDTSDDEEASEPEQNNKAVEVVSSNVDPTSLSVVDNQEMTPTPDSPSAKGHSVASSSDPPTPISPSVTANINVHSVPRGSTREMRSRPSTAQESSRRFTPLGFRPPMLRRSSAVNSSDLFEDTVQGKGAVQGRDKAIVMDDVEKGPRSLDSCSAEAAADLSYPTRIALASSSSVDISPSASSSSSRAASKRRKEEKATFTPAATTIGSKWKQPIPIETLATASSSSASSPTKAKATEVMAHKVMLSPRKPGSDIEIADDKK
ncbi:hypothetical protein BGZ50_001258 [Haplosporangium sp. Z 11]|nr:hypothetical protein BGZ50_001258 [Haplosporangium sp. Z 11]